MEPAGTSSRAAKSAPEAPLNVNLIGWTDMIFPLISNYLNGLVLI